MAPYFNQLIRLFSSCLLAEPKERMEILVAELEEKSKEPEWVAQWGAGSQRTAWGFRPIGAKKTGYQRNLPGVNFLWALKSAATTVSCIASCNPEREAIRRVSHSLQGRWCSLSPRNPWCAHGCLLSPGVHPFPPLSNSCPLLTWYFHIAGHEAAHPPMPCLPLGAVPPRARCWASLSFRLFLCDEDDSSPLS